jgi:hypothetical protein
MVWFISAPALQAHALPLRWRGHRPACGPLAVRPLRSFAEWRVWCRAARSTWRRTTGSRARKRCITWSCFAGMHRVCLRLSQGDVHSGIEWTIIGWHGRWACKVGVGGTVATSVTVPSASGPPVLLRSCGAVHRTGNCEDRTISSCRLGDHTSQSKCVEQCSCF